MNWSKIKTLMIWFLAVMNIFMISFIAITSFRVSSVPEEVVEASYKVLQKDGFELSADIIPVSTMQLPVLNAEFYSESELSEIFFSNQLAFKTTNNSLVATENLKTLTISENRFTYDSGKSPDKSHSKRKILKALEDAGINMDRAVYDEKERCFYRMYDNVNLFNIYLMAELDSDGKLCYVSALWPGKITPSGDTTLTFSSVVKKVKTVFPEGGKITLIEPGYALTPPVGGNSQFIPAWRLKVDEKLEILY